MGTVARSTCFLKKHLYCQDRVEQLKLDSCGQTYPAAATNMSPKRVFGKLLVSPGKQCLGRVYLVAFSQSAPVGLSNVRKVNRQIQLLKDSAACRW